MVAILVSCFALALGVEEGAGDARPAPVASNALAAGLAGPGLSAIRALAPVDDDGNVRVVLVVLDHLAEELVRELTRDHAVDHGLSVGRYTAKDTRSPGILALRNRENAKHASRRASR